ncbi:ABC transporter permease [Stagnihabitans tardus]|uniref:ABC transporter permease n=1 Tax=Stagnihabitans tardus TaxID=2699202 RepID=A0AAE4YEQ6_9RHOB|nr:ABC transporter permease [Stagnihabitans tardus]NBZ88769.1 ABC transporter permease [Stagnihabitans tardus]
MRAVLTRLPLVLLALPVAAGLLVAVIQSQGAWGEAWALPGLMRAARLSLVPGLAATLVALTLTGLILALEPPGTRTLFRLLAAFLALPHAALALGLAFLAAPSGPIARLVAPLMGWQAPPDLLTVGDPNGLGLTLGLILKETPFLLLLALAARGPDLRRLDLVASTFGHGRALRFALIEAPLLYRRLRLPVLAVLAYGMTTVDMGAILGPGLPAPLSVEVTRAATRADLGGEGLAAALALMQLALVALALALWRGVEALAAALARALVARGARGVGWDAPLRALATLAAWSLIALPLAALSLLALRVVTLRWPFPDLVPLLSLRPLGQTLPALPPLAANSLALALASTALALALALIALQGRSRLEALIWLPLILPQVVFLPGIARLMIGVEPWSATLAAHVTFALPYLWLSLAGPWRAWNPRLAQVAATLGASPARILWRLRLPMLAPSLAAATAIGIAVSTGQYLATLLMSGGRLPTLTTEAVALSTGPDRALVAALALAQAALPLVAFALAARVKLFPSRPQGPKERP